MEVAIVKMSIGVGGNPGDRELQNIIFKGVAALKGVEERLEGLKLQKNNEFCG